MNYYLGTIQLISFATSLLSLVWNTMEWNWIGHHYDCCKRVWVRIQLLPLFVVSTAYKCISVSVIVWYLNWYSVPSIGLVGFAIAVTDFIIRKNHLKFSKHAKPNQSETESAHVKYQRKGVK